MWSNRFKGEKTFSKLRFVTNDSSKNCGMSIPGHFVCSYILINL